MTTAQFNNALRKLGLTPYASAAVLGIGLRQAHRYAAGDAAVPLPVAKLLAALLELQRR